MPEKPNPSSDRRRPPARSRRWRWFIAVLIVLVIAIGFAPTVVSNFFLDTLIKRASQQVNGQLMAKSASFGWFSPIEFRGLQGRDPRGRQIFAINQLHLDKSLLSLLIDRSALGTIQLDSPQIHVVMRKNGSNVEDFFRPLLSKPPNEGPLDVSWNVKNARIEFLAPNGNEGAPPEAVLEAPSLNGRFQRSTQQSLEASGEINVFAHDQRGHVSIDARAAGFSPGQQVHLRNASGRLSAKIENVPLTVFQPIVRRFTDQVAVDGILNGVVEGELKDGQAHVKWTDFGTDQNQFMIAALSNDQPLTCEQIQSSGELHWNGDDVNVDTSLVTDFGTATVKITSLSPGDGESLLRAVSTANLDVSAKVDLPRLARALPDRMGLRDDVSITSGSVELELRGQPRNTETVWTASLVTSDLAGTRGATSLVWNDPIRAKLAARWSRGRLAIDDLECRSEFLTANLKGNADDVEVQLDGDLQKLANRMRQFFELPADFAGKLEGHVSFKRRPPEILVNGQLTARDFIWLASEHAQLHEPSIVLTASATLRQDQEQRLQGVSAASAQLVAGDDMLKGNLKQAIDLQDPAFAIPLSFTLRGNLAQWKNRLQTVADLQAFSLGGLCDATGDVSFQGRNVTVEGLQGELHDLVITGEGVQINEPRVTVHIKGQWDGVKKKWTTTQGEFATSALAASGDDIQLLLGNPPSATGKLMVRADLGRLQSWFPSSVRSGQQLQLAGEFIGEAFLDHESVSTLIQIDGGVEGFSLSQLVPHGPGTTVANSAPQLKPIWNEKEARITATARWREGGNLDVHTARLEGEGWSLLAYGKMTNLPSNPVLDLEGSADYNWQTLAPRLRFTAGDTLLISGERHEPLILKGPLFSSNSGLVSPELMGSGAVGWDAARFQDVVVGRGEMTGELKDAILQFSLLEIPVSQGMLSVAPRIDLRQAPARLEIPPGTVLKDVQITPTMCNTWLKFVVPTIANPARAEGSFDLQLDQFSMPIDQPERATITGSIVIHEARVSASPLSEIIFRVSDGLTSLTDRRLSRLTEIAGGTWIELPSQVIAFEMKDGRILHRDTKMQVKDLTVSTHGSVGVDKSLDLMVDLNRKGKSFRIPIRADSIDNVDVGRIVVDVLQENAGTTVEGLLEDQLREGLKKGLKEIFRDR